MIQGSFGQHGGMAEQHGSQGEHHKPVPEKEFYDRARQRLDEVLKNIAEIEERLEKNLGRGKDGKRKTAG
jgi:hypothetical protein